MQIRLLGPVEIGATGAQGVPLGRAKERAVLVVLAIHANQPVSEGTLIDALWGEEPPRTAGKTLQAYISRLRGALAGSAVSIETTPAGYRLRVERADLDVTAVEDLIARARAAAADGDHATSAVVLSDAARAWRGTPLGEFASEPWAIAESARLAELRLVVLEERIDAELACGRHAAVDAELQALCANHPLREGLFARRMISLYRAGRQADALRVYQDLRKTLAEELGIDPGPELQRLERSVLAQDASLEWDAGDSASDDAHRLPTGVVTFLLTDIEASTQLWQADAAAMSDALRIHDDLVARVVAASGGILIKAKGEGDSTLSVFARASDAAAAAVRLQAQLLTVPWPGGLDVRVRVALHTGEAEHRGGDYFGPSLNRAARLRAIAEGGQVLCSRPTADLVVDSLPTGVALVELGRRELRDLSRAEHVFALVREYGVDDETAEDAAGGVPTPAAIHAHEGEPFVGRADELARLRARWDAARAGERSVVLLSGEPGIGKTRLAASTALVAHGEGATVLYGRCDEDLDVAYQPFIQALRHYVANCPRSVLRSHVDAEGAELSRIVPELGQRLPSLPPLAATEPETEKLRLFDAVANILALAAEDAPVVLVLEDLHSAAKATLTLLHYVARASARCPLLIIGTFRDTEVGRTAPLGEMLADLRRIDGVERIGLSGLATDAVADLLAELAHQERNAATVEFAETLHARTGGNPFFVHEICRHLAEAGAVHRAADGWVAEHDLDAGLPEGVRDVIGRRLSRLSERANRALAVASVAGADFELKVLEQADDFGGTSVLDELDEAVAAGLVVEVADAAGHYQFSHSLIRQTLYEELSTARRVRLHGGIARTIEAIHATDLSPHLAALARHFGEAAIDGEAQRAAYYGLAAGRQALDALAFDEAAAHAEAGLRALDLLADADDAVAFDLWMALAAARTGLFDRENAKAAALEAARCARAMGSIDVFASAVLAATEAVAGWMGPEPDAALLEVCDEALDRLGGDALNTRARLLAAVAEHHAFNSQSAESVPLARGALDMAREAGDAVTVAHALRALLFAQQGSPEVAVNAALAEELVVIARQARVPVFEAFGLFFRTGARIILGDRDGFDEGIEELDRVGRDHRLVIVSLQVGEMRMHQAILDGRFADAGTWADHLMTVGGHDLAVVQATMAIQLLSTREQGRLEEVGPAFEVAIDDHQAPQTYHIARAWIQLNLGDESAAHTMLDELVSEDFARVRRWDASFPGPLGIVIELTAFTGHTVAARGLYGITIPYQGMLMGSAGVLSFGAVDRFLGMLAAVMGEFDLALEHFEAAVDFEERIRAPGHMARTKYWLARTLLDCGAAGDRDRALVLLDDVTDAAQAFGLVELDGLTNALRVRL